MVTAKIEDEILFLSDFKDTITRELVKGFAEKFKETTEGAFKYVAYKNIIGYYTGYDPENDKSIYCGTMSKKTTIEQIKEYDKNMCNK